jgi:peptide/nickel transport system permease protein
MTTNVNSGLAPDPQSEADEVDLVPVRTYWQMVRRRFLHNKPAIAGLLLLSFLILSAIIVPTVTGDAYKATSLYTPYQGPELAAPLGYDDIGQNIYLRLMKALQTSLFIGFAAVTIIFTIGVTVGAIAGYFGGWVDNMLMRFVDIVLSLPTLFLIIMLVAFFGGGNVWVIVFAIGLTSWTTAARLVRATFLSLRESDFVQAAHALGASRFRIITRHMLPGALAPILVACTLGIADSVVAEATLSYLSFGISPPDASLGNMLTNALSYVIRLPMLIVYPGVTIILIVLSASFLGDGLRDALDPRQRVEG